MNSIFCSVLHIDKISQCSSVSVRFAICSVVGIFSISYLYTFLLWGYLIRRTTVARGDHIARAKLSSLFRGCSKAHEKVIRGKVTMHGPRARQESHRIERTTLASFRRVSFSLSLPSSSFIRSSFFPVRFGMRWQRREITNRISKHFFRRLQKIHDIGAQRI